MSVITPQVNRFLRRAGGARASMAGFAAAKILEDILGAYFEDMDEVMLNIFEGHILLQNIEVRAGAIQNALGLPLEVKVGTIGRVELRIPWAKLNSEPTQLLLDDLFIICGPQSEAVWVDDVEAERAFQKKQATLASRERQPVPDESQAKETFQTKLTQAVLGRLEVPRSRTIHATPRHTCLPRHSRPRHTSEPRPPTQVRVSNVVLRYDDNSHGAVPYSITLRIRSLHLQNGDAPDAALAALAAPAPSPHAAPEADRAATGGEADVVGVATVAGGELGSLAPAAADDRAAASAAASTATPAAAAPAPAAAAAGSSSSSAAAAAAAAAASAAAPRRVLHKRAQLTGLSVCCAGCAPAPAPPHGLRKRRQAVAADEERERAESAA